MQLHFGITIERDVAFHMIRLEDNLGILFAFEDVLVHAFIAPFAAAIAARRIDGQFARGRTVSRIELDCPALQLEGPVDRVQRIL